MSNVNQKLVVIHLNRHTERLNLVMLQFEYHEGGNGFDNILQVSYRVNRYFVHITSQWIGNIL